MEHVEVEVEKNSNELTKIISSIIEKGATYVIKGMPVNEHIKTILRDVSKTFEDKDFNAILSVAIKSSIREGLDAMGVPKDYATKISNAVNAAFKGGVTTNIKIGIDVFGNGKKYGNIFANYIEDFLSDMKNFVGSNAFKNKVEHAVNKTSKKIENFKDVCEKWYDAYDDFNIDLLKEIASKLNKMKDKVSFDSECVSENIAIQNMTELVDSRKQRLTKTQIEICNNLDEIE